VQKRKKQAQTAELVTYSIPQAGAMVGLSRNGSYDAAKRGEIPVIKFGSRLVVPKAVWDKKLGLTGEAGMSKVQANGITMNYEQQGTGEPLSSSLASAGSQRRERGSNPGARRHNTTVSNGLHRSGCTKPQAKRDETRAATK
jgi:hypothetical protein